MSKLFELQVKVMFHLNEGYAKVKIAGFGIDWDITTNLIPRDLRMINSRFILKGDFENRNAMKVVRID